MTDSDPDGAEPPPGGPRPPAYRRSITLHTNTDYVATRTGDQVRVKLSTGWTIIYIDGATHAQISAPGSRRVYRSVEAPNPPTVENLATALGRTSTTMRIRPTSTT